MNSDITIVYLHGFASDGLSAKAQLIKKYFSDWYNVISPTLSEKPQEAIKQIRKIISNKGQFIFIGTSLGGFYANYFNKLADIPCLLINPLVEPDNMVRHIGVNKNYSTGKTFIFSKEDVKYLNYLKKEADEITYTDSPEYIIVAKDDELCDWKIAKDTFINVPNKLPRLPSVVYVFTSSFIAPTN
jgi:predicted esterase YcpF (UPF0227 family)